MIKEQIYIMRGLNSPKIYKIQNKQNKQNKLNNKMGLEGNKRCTKNIIKMDEN